MALKLLLPALLAALVVAPTGASAAPAGPGAVMATIHRFVDGFNRGDMKTALATCASPASIIDEFMPHAWQGATACADWARDLDASNKASGITGGTVTLGSPWILDVDGNANGNFAYVVIPATFAYKLHGKPQVESGSIWTIALKMTPAGWRIAAWAWAKR